MADFNKAGWQDVEHEAPDELGRLQRHSLDPVIVLGVPPAKSDLPVFHPEQATVGDGHAVRVAGQIPEHMVWSTKGRLGMDYPLDTLQLAHQGVKAGGLSKGK